MYEQYLQELLNLLKQFIGRIDKIEKVQQNQAASTACIEHNLELISTTQKSIIIPQLQTLAEEHHSILMHITSEPMLTLEKDAARIRKMVVSLSNDVNDLKKKEITCSKIQMHPKSYNTDLPKIKRKQVE